jgi:large subunit ribosomal protein L4
MADETNQFDAAAYTARGTARERVSLPAATFDGTINMPVMHQAVKAYLANQRQGNAATKIRKYVVGGNQKPWKQKGTGRARQGSTRAPHFVGGGTVFGPTPRAYDQYVPRQVRALAKKSALNARARENAIFVIDAFAYDAPKATAIRSLVARLGVAEQKVLILTDGVKENVYLSARNFPNVHVMPYADASTYHILWSDVVLIEAGAIGQTLEPVAESEADAAAPAAKKAAAKKSAAKKSARKTAGEE